MSSSELAQKAFAARAHAHAPYSGYLVGAAAKLSNGVITVGANLENASFGATVCAERVAIWKGMSEHPQEKIVEIAVATDQEKPWPPCGLCLQVMSEFASPEMKVHLCNKTGIVKTLTFKELFPHHFSPSHLSK